MTRMHRIATASLTASAMLAFAASVHAQSSSETTYTPAESGMSESPTYDNYDAPAAGGTTTGTSWLPYTTRGYVGVAAGRTELDNLPCSTFYRTCDDDNDNGWKVYTGGMFNDYFGLELGYFNTGKFDRSGGRVRAQGANLSLLAQAPLGNMAAVFVKAGGVYGWSKTSAGPLALDTRTGSESGPGVSYGAGLRFNVTPNWAIVVEWEQMELDYAGDDHQDTTFTTLGLQYRF